MYISEIFKLIVNCNLNIQVYIENTFGYPSQVIAVAQMEGFSCITKCTCTNMVLKFTVTKKKICKNMNVCKIT